MKTRENPDTGRLEVLSGDEWVDFEAYRAAQIAAAYDNSIRFLRDRLGEEGPPDEAQRRADDSDDRP